MKLPHSGCLRGRSIQRSRPCSHPLYPCIVPDGLQKGSHCPERPRRRRRGQAWQRPRCRPPEQTGQARPVKRRSFSRAWRLYSGDPGASPSIMMLQSLALTGKKNPRRPDRLGSSISSPVDVAEMIASGPTLLHCSRCQRVPCCHNLLEAFEIPILLMA